MNEEKIKCPCCKGEGNVVAGPDSKLEDCTLCGATGYVTEKAWSDYWTLMDEINYGDTN